MMIKGGEHRPLKEAEAKALSQLREGRQSVLAGDNDHPTLVGAVRATADCLKCHEAKEGQLLGAFSYPLVPVEPAADGDAHAPAAGGTERGALNGRRLQVQSGSNHRARTLRS